MPGGRRQNDDDDDAAAAAGADYCGPLDRPGITGLQGGSKISKPFSNRYTGRCDFPIGLKFGPHIERTSELIVLNFQTDRSTITQVTAAQTQNHDFHTNSFNSKFKVIFAPL